LNSELLISKHKRLKAVIHTRNHHLSGSFDAQDWRNITSVSIMSAFFVVGKMLVSHESLIAARDIASKDFFFIFAMLGEMVLEASLCGQLDLAARNRAVEC